MTKTRTWPYMRWVGGAGALLALSACATLPSIPGDLATMPIRAKVPRAVPGTTTANPYGTEPYAPAYHPAARATAQLHVTVTAGAKRYRTLALGREVARVTVALTSLNTGVVEARTLTGADLARPVVVADFPHLVGGPVAVHAVAIAADGGLLMEGTASAEAVASRSAGLTVVLAPPGEAAPASQGARAMAARPAGPTGCKDFIALDADRSGAVDIDEFRAAAAPPPPEPAAYGCAPEPYEAEAEAAYDEACVEGSEGEDAGLISNNAGGLISNNPGGLISNSQGGLIASNAGGLITTNGSAPDLVVDGFRALDADVDGLLSAEELCGWEAPATPRAAR